MKSIHTVSQVSLLLALLGWGIPLAAGAPLALAPGASAAGVSRDEPRVLLAGPNSTGPTIAISPAGRLTVALVTLVQGAERIVIRQAIKAGASLGPARVVSSGERAWRPRLAAGEDGSVWLAWSGLKRVARVGDHRRQIFLRKVSPKLGKTLVLSEGGRRAADPDLSVAADGSVHVVWEQDQKAKLPQTRVAHVQVAPNGVPMSRPRILSHGLLDRRPAIQVSGPSVFVAWDSLDDEAPSRAEDPDYDLWIREFDGQSWLPALAVDRRSGIQAAPDLAPAPEGGVLVAYHSSHRHSLVKWWNLRRVKDGKVSQLAAQDPAALDKPAGEQQGAEFPDLVRLADGRLVVFTRPSQGAYVQVVDGRGVGPVLDLTRAGWGARGMSAQAVPTGDGGTLLMVRRARKDTVLERLVVQGAAGAKPRFTPIGQEKKRAPPELAERVRPGGSFFGAPGQKLLWGDLHMHSAASDGTGPPDEILARAFAGGLDFAALTDHDNIVGQRMFPSLQGEIAWLSDHFDARPNFTVLHAYEWTTPPLPKGSGHYNVYFRDQPPRKWCAYRGQCPDSDKLLAYLKAERAMAIPHHTSWTGIRWRALDQERQRLVEIISVHGSSENGQAEPIAPRGSHKDSFVVDGLAQGVPFGLVGGSDAHGLLWHHGLGRKRNPWHCGLTGVLVEGRERASLFAGLHARRTVATTGLAMGAFIKVDSLAMGRRGKTGPNPTIHFLATGIEKLARIEIVRDGQVVQTIQVESQKQLQGEWRDRTVAPGPHSYYLRAWEETAPKQPPELVWSSPVFVDVQK